MTKYAIDNLGDSLDELRQRNLSPAAVIIPDTILNKCQFLIPGDINPPEPDLFTSSMIGNPFGAIDQIQEFKYFEAKRGEEYRLWNLHFVYVMEVYPQLTKNELRLKVIRVLHGERLMVIDQEALDYICSGEHPSQLVQYLIRTAVKFNEVEVLHGKGKSKADLADVENTVQALRN